MEGPSWNSKAHYKLRGKAYWITLGVYGGFHLYKCEGGIYGLWM